MTYDEFQLKQIMGELLKQNGYFRVNKRLMSALGISKATILSACIDRWNFVGCKEFYYRLADLATLTRQNEKTIRRDMQELVELGLLIKGRLKGNPPKQYYDINIQMLAQIITTPSEIDDLENRFEKELKSITENCPMENLTLPNSAPLTLPNSAPLTLPNSAPLTLPNSGGIYNNKNKEYKNKVIRTNTNAHASDALVAPAKASGLECEPLITENSPTQSLKQKPYSKKYTNEQIDLAFESFWEHYPKKENKQEAKKAYINALNGVYTNRTLPRSEPISIDGLQNAIEAYKQHLVAIGKIGDKNFLPNATTWLNNQRYDNAYNIHIANGREAIAHFNQQNGLKGDSAVKGYYNLPRHLQEDIEGNWRDFMPKTEAEREANELAVKKALGLIDEE